MEAGGMTCGQDFRLAMVQSDHEDLSLNQSFWQHKAVCDTIAPTWQASYFPSNPCLGSWPTFPCRPAKRIRTEGGGRLGETKRKREPCCFSLVCLLAPSDIITALIPDARRPKVFFPIFIWLGCPFYNRCRPCCILGGWGKCPKWRLLQSAVSTKTSKSSPNEKYRWGCLCFKLWYKCQVEVHIGDVTHPSTEPSACVLEIWKKCFLHVN